MHYKNGREAKNGDKVVLMPSYGNPVIGILYDATAGNNDCNGFIAQITPNDRCPDLKEVLHLDDLKAALPTEVPDSSKKDHEGEGRCDGQFQAPSGGQFQAPSGDTALLSSDE